MCVVAFACLHSWLGLYVAVLTLLYTRCMNVAALELSYYYWWLNVVVFMLRVCMQLLKWLVYELVCSSVVNECWFSTIKVFMMLCVCCCIIAVVQMMLY